MMYIRPQPGQNFVYQCPACAYTRPPVVQGIQRVSELSFFNDSSTDTSAQFMTPNIANDPTLPRVNNIPCPNPSCTRAADQANRVIYVKYDDRNMLYVYFCEHCQHFWRNGRHK
jgi:DNA-directed RNA polymerase subunit M/transcription elongation factor TFIIS